MRSTIVRAVGYWLRATFRPRHVMREMTTEAEQAAIAVWINLIFAILYAITALIYYAIGRLPVIEPWIPVAEERYYLYQAFWTVPWGLATWIMFSGIAHLLASAGRPGRAVCQFEDALMVCALGWVVPSMVLMWIPETLVVPILGAFWPAWVETLRLMVLPVIWQTLLVAVGLRETHEVGWLRGLGIGLVTVLAFFISFLAYMR
jgi:hypothetical protein